MARFYTNPGSPIKINKIAKVDKDGSFVLIDGEKTDFQAYIESFREETDIENIIARFNNGDVGALSKAQGFYGDYADVPKNYADILNMVYEGQRVFDTLPVDIKEKFDNDFNKWFASMGEESWIKNMTEDEFNPVEDKKVEEEVKE